MNKQIEHLSHLHETRGLTAVLNYLKDNKVANTLTTKTFTGSGSPAKKLKSGWLSNAAENEFRCHYDDYVERSKTGLSQTRLRAISILLK